MTPFRHPGHGRVLATAFLTCAALVGGALAGANPARAAGGALRQVERTEVAPGVEYQEFAVSAAHGTAYGHLLTVDLRDPRVSLDLLYPGAVGAREAVSALAEARGAVGAVNGDFFDISETQHPEVEATGAPVGPEVAGGRRLKAAVPDGQRFGPTPPPGTSADEVIGMGADRTLRLGRLTLRGTVRTVHGTLPLRGFNQYAIPVDGIGAYTSAWGTVSRARAACGTDQDRGAPCSSQTYEVTVRRGRVVSASATLGSGPIAAGSVVLAGREEGAAALRGLRVGDPVRVEPRVQRTGRAPFAFALGGFPIARKDRPVAGLDAVTGALRTSAGIGDRGHRLYLLALDGRDAGLTLAELAAVMLDLGADDAVDLDGGGSTTLVTRPSGSAQATVRNHPSGGAERPVPNAIGVFLHR